MESDLCIEAGNERYPAVLAEIPLHLTRNPDFGPLRDFPGELNIAPGQLIILSNHLTCLVDENFNPLARDTCYGRSSLPVGSSFVMSHETHNLSGKS